MQVLLVKCKKTDQLFAMKVATKSETVRLKQLKHVFTERNILQQLEHPFIAKMHASLQSQSSLFLLLTFYSGGELFYHLKKERRFSTPRVQLYAAEVLLALQVCPTQVA